MRPFTIIHDANRRDNNIAAIHREGCHAAIRELRPGARAVNHTGTLRQALDIAVDPEDRRLGYTDDDVKVHRCVSA